MTRRPESYDGPGEPVGADVYGPASLGAALRRRATSAIYLVHSLDDPDFERKDAECRPHRSAPRPPRPACKQIVYMGGLGADGAPALARTCARAARSRACSAGTACPVTVLRAAIVVGHGGISWEITRQLVKNLPAMVVPKWVGTRTQPIAIDDVVRYLAGVVDHPDAAGRGLRDRRARAADLPRDDAGSRRGDERPVDPDRRHPAAHPRAVVALAGAGHRRRRHDRTQPHRLDVDRGRRARHLDPRRRAGRAADLSRVRPSRAGRPGRCRGSAEQG